MRQGLLRLAAMAVVARWLVPARTWVWPVGQRHPWRVAGRTVFVGDHEYLVRQIGPPDAPSVVLVHGLGGSSVAEWFGIGPHLSGRFRVTLVDGRNHGLSYQTTDRFEVEDVADDLAAVLDLVGVERAVLAGYSMGGAVVQALAHRHPRLAEGVVLVASFARHPPAWRWARELGVWFVRGWERMTGMGTAEVRAGYLLATGAVPRVHARWLWEETKRRDIEGGYQASFALLRFDSRDWIGRLEVPALVVIPGRDQLVPLAWQYELAGSLRDAEVLELPDARHEAPMTHAAPIADAIGGFVDRHHGTASSTEALGADQP